MTGKLVFFMKRVEILLRDQVFVDVSQAASLLQYAPFFPPRVSQISTYSNTRATIILGFYLKHSIRLHRWPQNVFSTCVVGRSPQKVEFEATLAGCIKVNCLSTRQYSHWHLLYMTNTPRQLITTALFFHLIWHLYILAVCRFYIAFDDSISSIFTTTRLTSPSLTSSHQCAQKYILYATFASLTATETRAYYNHICDMQGISCARLKSLFAHRSVTPFPSFDNVRNGVG